MKRSTTLAVVLALISTSALAFQEKPSPNVAAPSATTAKTTALSRFAADENDGTISQVYAPGTFSSTQTTSNGYPVPVPRHRRE
ncbi:hypothetical protein [Enterobacter sp. CC120223-11]|uniref:hypothetical protein n=1 Tax=Enterobacter sp. CC120223-11 TaxID=1378073 RepID=UPI000BD55E78|nr:hypothetical protein [Enterobacter sp. CC120223-11]SNY76774.1 hypothetical protein SAMN02744775_03566 [Enterobacter sp. CC120223-11]